MTDGEGGQLWFIFFNKFYCPFIGAGIPVKNRQKIRLSFFKILSRSLQLTMFDRHFNWLLLRILRNDKRIFCLFFIGIPAPMNEQKNLLCASTCHRFGQHSGAQYLNTGSQYTTDQTEHNLLIEIKWTKQNKFKLDAFRNED